MILHVDMDATISRSIMLAESNNITQELWQAGVDLWTVWPLPKGES